MPCASMIFTAACATRWWPKKFSSKLLRKHRLVDLADAALPGRAGVRDDDVDAAERLRRPASNAVAHRRRIGDVAGDRERARADGLGLLGRGGKIDVEQRDLGAGRRERLGGGGADRAAGAGDDGDLAGERQLLRRLPSLACSIGQYSLSNMSASVIDWKRPMASASVMAATAASARSAAMRASFAERPSPKRPRPGTSTTRGRGSSMRLAAADARVVAREILPGSSST